MKRSRAVFTLSVMLITALTFGLTGCAGPEFTYVRHDSGETYFKVPASWHAVDQETLSRFFTQGDPDSATAQVRKELIWLAAYDADAEPAVGHLYGLGSTDEPFVFVRVTTLLREQRDMMSLNVMRDALLPVTESARQQASAIPGYPATDFELLADEVIEPGDGLQGVHVRFNYAIQGAGTHTFDLTAYLAADGQRLSTMLIRCSASCYRDRAAELDVIAQSFKVIKRPIG
ncbi:hypothetical protein Pta02_12480 [Planobispora takensis]|uniref:Lipoprotein n=2 Tax=Planobispora takensis TaxID=1367882 RepID=A0A8J3STU6_9ACTN|nr:hypothetical protein Pta02_12480 [Planobispora takensis]